MSEEHLFQIWCLYLSYKESYDQKTASMSFLEIYIIMTSCTVQGADRFVAPFSRRCTSRAKLFKQTY